MDITGVILLTGIGLVVGFLVAALIFSVRKESSPKEVSQQLLSDSENKVRVWREGGEQRLVVEMDGVLHRQESDLHADQKQKLITLVSELQTWIGASTAAAAVVPPQPAKSEPAIEKTGDEQEGTNLNPLKIFGAALQPQKKTEADEIDQSIVSQIDQILQTRLEGTNLEDRGIRLVEGPDQGMVIEIGLDKYTEIDAVPDAQVRQLIRLSVADWEKTLGD